jgi:hypothetical protein
MSLIRAMVHGAHVLALAIEQEGKAGPVNVLTRDTSGLARLTTGF